MPMEHNVYDDERIVDDATAQKLATAYSAMITALDARMVNPPTEMGTNDLLQAILLELKAIHKEMQYQKRIRLEF